MGNENKNIYSFSSTPPLVLVSEEIVCERGKQGNSFNKELVEYGVLLRDLTDIEIPYSIKNEILNIAFYIIGDVECYDLFKRKKDIPITILCREFIKPRKYFEQWKDFIIAYVIILGNSNYKYIQDYIMVVENEENKRDLITALTEKRINVKGIVLKTRGKSAKIITSDGEFLNIKINTKASIGEEVEGKINRGIKEYKVQLSILAFMAIILIGTFIYNYVNVTSTIMVKTTSPIMIELNKFNRVKSINSYTEKGKTMISTIKVLDRSFDSSLVQIIDYAKKNEMIPLGGIIITVNGNQLERGELKKTEDYIFIEQINVSINNSGMEYKLY